jgi:hypothetical protein
MKNIICAQLSSFLLSLSSLGIRKCLTGSLGKCLTPLLFSARC